MGLSGVTYPFDWLRTTLDSVLTALREDFEGFLDYRAAVPHYDRPRVLSDEEIAADDHTPFEVVYACDGHALWHCICWDERDLESCQRRALRLLGLRQPALRGPALFVRAASTGEELLRASELIGLLRDQFGPQAHLLILLSSQPSLSTVFFTELPQLIVATLGSDYNPDEEYFGVVPLYRDAIWDTVWYIQQGQRPSNQVELASLDSIEDSGLFDMHVDLGENTMKRWSPCASWEAPSPIPTMQFLDEGRLSAGKTVGNARIGFTRLRADVGDVRAISLGSWCGVKAAIHEFGFPKDNLPFDWLRTSIDGIMDALRSDFSNFLEYDSVISRTAALRGPSTTDFVCADNLPFPSATPVVGTVPPRHEDIYVARGHAFWYDDLTHDAEHLKYERRFQGLRCLKRQDSDGVVSSLLLFVRAVNTTAELHLAPALEELLQEQFGEGSYLLMLVGDQLRERSIIFEQQPRLIVQTLTKEPDLEGEGLAALLPAYLRSLQAALDIMQADARTRGDRRGAFTVRSLEDLLCGPDWLLREAVLGEDLTQQWTLQPQESTTSWRGQDYMTYELVE